MGNFTKRVLIAFFCIAAIMSGTCKCFAQSYSYGIPDLYDSNTAKRFGIYLIGGVTVPYTDVKSPRHASYLGGIAIAYYPFPFVCLSGAMHTGQLKAGDKSSNIPDNMYFENQVFDAVFLAKLFPLNLANDLSDKNKVLWSYLSTFYIGAGLGMVKSHVDVHRFYPSDFEYIGNYTGRDVVFPITAGFDIPVIRLAKNRSIHIDISYTVNFCHTDKLDGYVTPEYQNGKNDAYNFVSIGIGYRF